jgi:hypothetical protein
MPADVAALAPGRYVFELPVGRLLVGADLKLTVHVVRGGAGSGPSLGLLAGIDGDEVGGIRSIRDAITLATGHLA